MLQKNLSWNVDTNAYEDKQLLHVATASTYPLLHWVCGLAGGEFGSVFINDVHQDLKYKAYSSFIGARPEDQLTQHTVYPEDGKTVQSPLQWSQTAAGWSVAADSVWSWHMSSPLYTETGVVTASGDLPVVVRHVLVLSSSVQVVDSARDLGVVIDSHLTMVDHVTAVCRAAYFHLPMQQRHSCRASLHVISTTATLCSVASQTVILRSRSHCADRWKSRGKEEVQRRQKNF